jgi:hypothetical protein
MRGYEVEEFRTRLGARPGSAPEHRDQQGFTLIDKIASSRVGLRPAQSNAFRLN